MRMAVPQPIKFSRAVLFKEKMTEKKLKSKMKEAA